MTAHQVQTFYDGAIGFTDHLKDTALFAAAVTSNYLNQISFAEFGFGNRGFVILGLFHNIKNS
jgi:hypothetical protein